MFNVNDRVVLTNDDTFDKAKKFLPPIGTIGVVQRGTGYGAYITWPDGSTIKNKYTNNCTWYADDARIKLI